ncbi:MAG: DUF6600 domain-containing protein, partial [Spartobacteria bacterium]
NTMKRILLALTMVGLLLPFAPKAQADTEVSLNLFYDNLSSQGSWIEVADYGYCFQPSVAVSNTDWRPYSDGYWAYTDLGWTWVSYEDFGWATYHYGRWANLDSYGWVWVPGYEWGPAWVSWRTGGDYVGWAPLPPARGEVVYEGRAISNQVDIEFGIGPMYYNFVDIRYIGEPVLRGRILPPARNVTIINNTVNVTNITYNNSVVYNYGPDYNRLNQYSTRPVQRLTLQRETTVGANLGQGRKGNFNRVNGNQLMVVAPAIQKSQQKFAPKQVKAKVEKPTVETGWKGINNRQQVEAEMKKGDPKNIKAPDFQPQKGRKAEAVAGAQTGAEQQPANAAGQQGKAAEDANAGDQKAQQSQQAQQQREQMQQQREQARQQREQAQKDQAAQQSEAQKSRQEKRRNRQEQAAPDAGQPGAAQPKAEQSQQRESQQADRQPQQQERQQQRAEKRRAQQADQSGQEQAQPDREQAPERSRNARKARQADENQPADNGRSENSRPRRAPQAEDASSSGSAAADQNPADRSQPEQPQANRPERAQRQMQERRSQQQEQARPQQQQRQERQPGSDNPNNQRKGKKNKPTEEPTPQS